MLGLIYGNAKNLLQYVTSNLECLYYGVEVMANQPSLLGSYAEFLQDVTAIYGVWAAIALLTLSALMVMVVVHCTVTWVYQKLTNTNTFKTFESTLRTVTHKVLTRLGIGRRRKK